MDFSKVTEVKACPDYATTIINQALKDGWVILNISQFTNKEEGEAYGNVLLGKLNA